MVELCNIRNGLSLCDGLNYSNIICILNALCLQYIVFVYYEHTLDHFALIYTMHLCIRVKTCFKFYFILMILIIYNKYTRYTILNCFDQ